MPRQYTRTPIATRLLKRGARAQNGCLLWTGCVGPLGYAQIRVDQRQNLGVHVAAHLEWVGPIPTGHQVHHLCDVNYAPDDKTYRRCFEPSHLTTGTGAQNQQHMVDAGRSLTGDKNPMRLHPDAVLRGDNHPARTRPDYLPRGEQHGMARLTEALVIELRDRHANGESAYGLAKEHGLAYPTVKDAVRRRTWRHI